MRHLVLAFLLLAGCQQPPFPAQLTGSFIWTADFARFGGISGLEVSGDGQSYTAIGDRGLVFAGDIVRQDGRIVAMPVRLNHKLRGPDGRRVQRETGDSEGLAIAPDGTAYIAFEDQDRIGAYGDLTGPERTLPVHPDFAAFQNNAALEALAIDADGTLYAVPERSGRADRPFPVFRFADGVWTRAHALPRRGAFLAVGADFDPQGRFYLLERDFTGAGFRSRVRRFDLTTGREELILQTGNGTHDNLEGIAIWRAPDSGLRMTLVADDNYKFFQRTEVVEYAIPD